MTSAQYGLTLRLELTNQVGMLGKVTNAIGEAGGDIGAIDIVQVSRTTVTRDITVDTRNEQHSQDLIAKIKGLSGVSIVNVSDRTFLLHLGGKIEVKSKTPVKTRDDLSMAYTPGVARVCLAIAEDHSKSFNLTIRANTVAVVSDGTAVLGLGDIGPEAAMPVMEGKAMLFKEFAGVDAFPICLATKDTDEIVRTVELLAPTFGGVNLEDISAPRCFEIEERLKELLEIPVFHDDQHGTAVVVLAAAINALRVVKKEFDELKVVISGAGAAGMACAKILMNVGVKNVIACDRSGIIHKDRTENMNPMKAWFAENGNPENLKGSLKDAFDGADLFLGLSAPRLVTPDMLKKMNRDPIIFSMANPVPEIMPDEAAPYARVVATGRSDFPNQINNVLCFPGMFRGALDCRARSITEEMKISAAHAIASIVSKSELCEDYIIPSVFNKRVAKNIAKEVIRVATKTGVARRTPPSSSHGSKSHE
ncbi:MAG: NAD-dependent malic enzyme [Candidatus Tectomicrobia bacterium]|nr:NAD-dependent malic enzyme [Candidatus Tectomicrobia bacterium]